MIRGILTGLGRGIGKATAADAVTADLRRSTAMLGGLLVAIRRSEQPTRWLDDIDDASERFEMAAARYGRTDMDLRDSLRGLYRQFSIFFLATATFLTLAIMSTAGWSNVLATLGGLAAFGPAAVMMLLAARAAYYHFQIRARRLAGVGEWLRQPAEWIPLSSASSATGRNLMAVLLLLLAAVPAAAATTGAAQDQALTIINTLLPFSGGSATATVFSTALKVMVSSLLAAASGLGVYSVVAEVMAAASTGQTLTERAGFWPPLRFVGGMSLLAPVLGGFSPIHLLIYQFAIFGSGMATDVWSSYVGAVLGDTPAAATAPGIPPSVGGAKLAEQILQNEVCTDATLAEQTQVNSASGVTIPFSAALPPPGGTAITSASGAVTQVWTYSYSCGGFSIPVPGTGAPAPVVAFSSAQIAALSALVSAVRGTSVASQAGTWASGTAPNDFPTGILTQLVTAGQAYDQAMLAAAATLTSAQNATARASLTSAAAAGGWTQAFSYDRALAQASEQTAQAAAQAPTWAAPKANDSDAAAKLALKELGEELRDERGAGVLTADDLASAGQASDGYVMRLMEPVNHALSAAILNFSAADSTDPLGDLMSLGAKLSVAGQAGVAAAVTLAIPAGTLPSSIAGLALAFSTALNFCSPLIWGALASGWVLGYLLPMTPFIAGMWLAVTWAIDTVVIIVAAPIWAVLMVKLDGRELVDSTHKPFLASVVLWALKPVLGIIGYIAYRMLVSLVFPFLTAGFATAYVGAQGGHMVNLVGMIGGVGLLSFLSFQLLMRLTGLILQMGGLVGNALGLGGGGSDAQAHHDRTLAVASSNRSGGQLGGGGSGGKGPKPSGGGAPGVKPAGGPAGSTGGEDGGGGPEPHWNKASGGLAGLSEGQRAAAEASFAEWAAAKPRAAAKYGIEGYVSHAQTHQAGGAT